MVDDQEINPNNNHQNVYKYFLCFLSDACRAWDAHAKKNVKKKRKKNQSLYWAVTAEFK